MVELWTKDPVEFGERELTRAVTRGDTIELPPVAKSRDHAVHFGFRDVNEVQTTEDCVDTGVDLCGRLQDLLNARVRTAYHQDETLRTPDCH